MRQARVPSGEVKKVIIICERWKSSEGKVYKDKERIYHTPEAAAEWWSRFAAAAWDRNRYDQNRGWASDQELKLRRKKYKRRALPIFKYKFSQLV